MSLRQLKFKPKFSTSKIKKNEETSAKEVIDIKYVISPPDCIENCFPDQNFPRSKEKKYDQEIGVHSELESEGNVGNNKQVSDVQSALKTSDATDCFPDQNILRSKEKKYDQEIGVHSELESEGNVGNNKQVSDVVQSALKTNDVTGKSILPSLRQLKCKPKLNSLPPRSSNKVATEIRNNEHVSESDSDIFKAVKSDSSQPDQTLLPSLLMRKDSALKENENNLTKLEEDQNPEKKQIPNEGVKNEIICRHFLPIRQINLPPKFRRPLVQNKTWQNSLSLIKNTDNGNKCENSFPAPEKKEIAFPSADKKNIEESTTPIAESTETICSSVNNISYTTNISNDSPNNASDSPKKFKTYWRKESKIFSKSSKLTKSNQAASKPRESSLNDTDDLEAVKSFNVPVKENKNISDLCINNSPKKKETKNRVVYGSKSIRSCHLGIPFKPKLTNRSKKPFASSTFGKMCFEAKAQFEKKFKGMEPDSTKLTMLDLIFYNPSSNPMPQEEKKSKKDSIRDINSNDALEKTSDLEKSSDNRNKSIDSNDIPVPQLKLSSDGKVIIAQESLVVKQSLGEISDDIEEITTERFKKRKNDSEEGSRAGWSRLETLKFYKALHTLGSDFETMKSIFPGRSRSNLKRKFKREERLHGKLIDKIMSQPAEFDLQKATEELKKSLAEKETDDLYKLTIKNLGRNLKKNKGRKARNREIKAKHPLLFTRTWNPPEKPKRKRTPPQKIEQVSSDLLDNGDECTIPVKRKVTKQEKKSTKVAHCGKEKSSDQSNIVISTNIEYDNVKLTQFITYNSNNLENPIDVNTTIAHESETTVSESLDVTQDN